MKRGKGEGVVVADPYGISTIEPFVIQHIVNITFLCRPMGVKGVIITFSSNYYSLLLFELLFVLGSWLAMLLILLCNYYVVNSSSSF